MAVRARAAVDSTKRAARGRRGVQNRRPGHASPRVQRALDAGVVRRPCAAWQQVCKARQGDKAELLPLHAGRRDVSRSSIMSRRGAAAPSPLRIANAHARPCPGSQAYSRARLQSAPACFHACAPCSSKASERRRAWAARLPRLGLANDLMAARLRRAAQALAQAPGAAGCTVADCFGGLFHSAVSTGGSTRGCPAPSLWRYLPRSQTASPSSVSGRHTGRRRRAAPITAMVIIIIIRRHRRG